MGNGSRYTKNGNNHIGEYCDKLISDFFQFCDGHSDQITTMVWIDDIKKPVPPNPKQMGIMLSRLDVIWRRFCLDAKLPREVYGLLIKKVKEKWLELGKRQEGNPIVLRKRKHVTENLP